MPPAVGGGGPPKKEKLAITNNGKANFRIWLAAECTVNTKFVREHTGTWKTRRKFVEILVEKALDEEIYKYN
jgi:frataxin-like iron-binding protein CyaY